jgi:hypothetical protein
MIPDDLVRLLRPVIGIPAKRRFDVQATDREVAAQVESGEVRGGAPDRAEHALRPRPGARPFGIDEAHGLVARVAIEVQAIGAPLWIGTDPPHQPRRVITMPVVGQAALFVPLAAGEAVSLACEAAEARVAVWIVFLAPQLRAAQVQCDHAAPEMVGELEANCGEAVVGKGVADPHERDAVLIVHEMNDALLPHGCVGGTARRVMLERVANPGCRFDRAAPPADHFLHTLPDGVVEIDSIERRGAVTGLNAEAREPVGVIPDEAV